MTTQTHFQILRLISAGGGTTRAELMEQMGLSKAAMSNLTRDLIDRGFLRETSMVRKQGRPSALLDLDPSGALFVGVSMMSDPAILALIDLKGGVVARTEFPRGSKPDDTVAGIASALTEVLEQAGLTRDAVSGIGVVLSGLIDPAQETCIRSTVMGWQDLPLAEMVRKATGLPAYIENDAKALAVNESLFGAARDLDSFTLVWLGAGIGSAHLVHGGLYRGAHGGAGEIAHITIDPEGPPCRCGKVGCLDTLASMAAILDLARAEGLNVSTVTELERLADGNNSAAIRLLHRAGSALGLAIAQIIQINDPQMVLLTHREEAFGGLFSTVLQQTIEANVLPSLSGVTPIRFRRLFDDDWVKSAASVATHKFLAGLIQKGE
ncbi:ROK family transcriptional regulator [Devosia sp. 2618]|uniref:ROK family transcriptional regulator n=1 Tax=Devosia sp. 2618 TaxID=3156454 RepID=UPI00339519C6